MADMAPSPLMAATRAPLEHAVHRAIKTQAPDGFSVRRFLLNSPRPSLVTPGLFSFASLSSS
jgi:hypothetical protein